MHLYSAFHVYILRKEMIGHTAGTMFQLMLPPSKSNALTIKTYTSWLNQVIDFWFLGRFSTKLHTPSLSHLKIKKLTRLVVNHKKSNDGGVIKWVLQYPIFHRIFSCCGCSLISLKPYLAKFSCVIPSAISVIFITSVLMLLYYHHI